MPNKGKEKSSSPIFCAKGSCIFEGCGVTIKIEIVETLQSDSNISWVCETSITENLVEKCEYSFFFFL